MEGWWTRRTWCWRCAPSNVQAKILKEKARGSAPGPRWGRRPQTPFYLFRGWHWLRDSWPNELLCENSTEDSRRAALTQAAARRRGSRGQSPIGANLVLGDATRYLI